MKNLFNLKSLFMIVLLFMTVPVLAYTMTEPGSTASVVVDLSTFVGIVAFVSLVVTQLAKKITVIEANTILKILTSVAIGILASFFSWWLGLADFLGGLLWWQVLIQGVLAGLSACGTYDLIKSIIGNK